MPNEFIIKNGYVAKGNSVISGSLIVTGNVTGIFSGSISGSAVSASYATTAATATSASYATQAGNATTASYALTASYVPQSISASYALTASYALNANLNTALSASYASTASYVVQSISSSYSVSAETADIAVIAVSSSFALTASYVVNSISSSYAITASYVLQSISSSYSSNSTSASYATTASYILQAVSASYSISSSYAAISSLSTNALTASYVTNLRQDVVITGSLFVSSSNVTELQIGTNKLIVNSTGVGINTAPSYVLDVNGAANLRDGLLVTGSITATTAFFGNLIGTASYIDTASYVNPLNQIVEITGGLYISGSNGGDNPSIIFDGSLRTSHYIRFDPTAVSFASTNSGSFIYSSGSTNDLYFSQNAAGYSNTTRLRWMEGNLYTGLLHGGLVTTQSSTVYQIQSGSGIIVSLNASLASDPYPTIQFLAWPTLSGSIDALSASYDQQFIGVQSNGTIYAQGNPFTDGQLDTVIPIGAILHQNRSTINGATSLPGVGYGWKQRSSAFINAFGPLKLSGFTLAVSGSSTGSLVVGSGTAYLEGGNYSIDPNNPSYVNTTGATTTRIFRYRQSGSSWIYDTNNGAGYGSVDLKNYSNNGTLTSVNNNEWTIQRVFFFPNSPLSPKPIVAYYGNAIYTSEAEALSNLPYETFSEAPNTAGAAIYLGCIIANGLGDFTNTATYTIYPGGLFRNIGGQGGGGSVVTQTLAALSDVNITGATNGQPLVYSTTSNKWQNSSTLTANLTGNASTSTSASYATTSSYVLNAVSSSVSLTAISASHAETAASASYVLNAITASYVLNAISASFATTASYVNLSVATSASFATTASYISPTFISASAAAAGFGVTASYALFSLSASHVDVAAVVSSASYAFTSSYGFAAISASYATTSSYATLASYVENIIPTLDDTAPDDNYITYVETSGTPVNLLISSSIKFNTQYGRLTTNIVNASAFTGSLFGTASHAVTASYISPTFISASAAAAGFGTGGGGGGGTPGGSDTQIQYNNGGTFGGDPVYTFDDINKSLQFGTNVTASNLYSFAGGIDSKALGSGSYVWGTGSVALGDQSYAHGFDSIASGTLSIADGYQVQATSLLARAYGFGNKAIGNYSVTDGAASIAAGAGSSTRGSLLYSLATLSNSEGIFNLAGLHMYPLYDNSGNVYVASTKELYADGDITAIAVSQSVVVFATEYYNIPYASFISSASFDGTFTTIYLTTDPTENSDQAYSANAFATFQILDSTALGTNHAEGFTTKALGAGSHTEGYGTIAAAPYAHAEGSATRALGTGSHVEGASSTAAAAYSHAEGYSTEASGAFAHTEGDDTVAYGYASHAEGYLTSTFGNHSHAEGGVTTAYGTYSHAEGIQSNAYGTGSHAEGSNTIASGAYSHTEGSGAITYGSGSHAEGSETIASGAFSHAEGQYSMTYGNYSHAEGSETFAYGNYSHAEGSDTWAYGNYSHAEGNFTLAYGQSSHAEGSNTIATSGHAEGDRTVVGFKTPILGQATSSYTTKPGASSEFTFGNTFAPGNYTSYFTAGTPIIVVSSSMQNVIDFVFSSSFNGTVTTLYFTKVPVSTSIDYIVASGYGFQGHAEGTLTVAQGQGSHAEGLYAVALGDWAHAEGDSSIAYGQSSHAEGLYTIASGSYQTVVGKYNAHNNTSSLFVVGGGSGEGSRKDAFEVRVDGSGNASIMLPQCDTSPTNPIAGSMYWSGSFIYLYNGSAWKSASLS